MYFYINSNASKDSVFKNIGNKKAQEFTL